MKLISVLWLIFTTLFSLLSYYHYDQSKITYPEFKVTELPGPDIMFNRISITKPLKDFAEDFNEYLHNQNISNAKQNRMSAIGYLAAALLAFFSFILSFEYWQNRANKKYNLNPYCYFKNGITRLRKLMKKDNSNDSD